MTRFQIRVAATLLVLWAFVGAMLFVSTDSFWIHSLKSLFASKPSASLFDYEIRYTPEGFQPPTLEVPLGSRVAFRNTTSIPLWAAADPYGTHTDYPDFNAGKNYNLGETYIVTFTQGGTFGFHNESLPTDHGTIRVTDPSHPVPDISKTIQRQLAVRDRLLTLFIPNDPSSIFTVVDTIESDPILSLDCHSVAHDLGHEAYELYGFSGAMAYSNPERLKHPSLMDMCAGGYVHGILEELSVHQPEFQKEPGKMCLAVPAGNRASCFHGVGHALMFGNNRAVAPSLTGCRAIKKPDDASRCFEGVFMELFWGDTEHFGANSLGWDVEKPLAPCIAVGTDAKPACFLYSSFGYLRTHPKDYSGAIQLCTQSNLRERDVEYCLKGVGITMMSHFKGQHLEGSETFAAGLTEPQKLSFYEGVMGYARLSGITESGLTTACGLLTTDTAVCLAAVTESK